MRAREEQEEEEEGDRSLHGCTDAVPSRAHFAPTISSHSNTAGINLACLLTLIYLKALKQTKEVLDYILFLY